MRNSPKPSSDINIILNFQKVNIFYDKNFAFLAKFQYFTNIYRKLSIFSDIDKVIIRYKKKAGLTPSSLSS